MASYGRRKRSRGGEFDIRRITRVVCTLVLLLLIFFWEPFGGMLGSAWWTVLMILDVLALAGVDCFLDFAEHKRAGIAAGPFSYGTVLKIVFAVIGILLLILIGWQAAKENGAEQSVSGPSAGVSDVIAQ